MDRSLHAAVIAEWRGLPERKMRTDRWQSPAELVPKMMQRWAFASACMKQK
jgi:hypothetical protein